MIRKTQTVKVRCWTEPVTVEPKPVTVEPKNKPSAKSVKRAANKDRARAQKDRARAPSAEIVRVHPNMILAFDTETTTDVRQALTIGAYMYAWIDQEYRFWPVEEGLFYADDLPSTNPTGFKILTEYVRKGMCARWYKNTPDIPKPGGLPPELIGLRVFGPKPVSNLTRDEKIESLKMFAYDSFYKHFENLIDDYIDDCIIDSDFGRTYWGFGMNQSDRSDDGSKAWLRRYHPVQPYSSWVSAEEIEILRARNDTADKPPRRPNEELELMRCSAFVNDRLYEVAHSTKAVGGEDRPATIVGANLPFDLSRIARSAGKSYNQFLGGFTLGLLPSDDDGLFEPIKKYGGMRIVRRGARGNLMSFKDRFRGQGDYSTDILNLGWILTNENFGLESAARLFGRFPEYQKSNADFSQGITDDLITYCRQDVRATVAAYCGMMREVSKHTENFIETKSYSPAALPKAYYKAMGIEKPLAKQPDYDRSILGHAMTTFYGARAECHARKVPLLPVAYYDFTSMYPTVDINMDLWELLTHERIGYQDETSEVQALLDGVTVESLLNRDAWPQLRGIALVKPDGDILPIRTQLKPTTTTIAIADVTSDTELWYTIPDLAASALLTGKAPTILKAYRFYPDGSLLPGLKPVKLRGETAIDPATQDFFKVAMEQRQAIKIQTKKTGHSSDCICEDDSHVGCYCERCRHGNSVKCTGTSGAYGVFAEFNPEPYSGEMRIHGIGESFTVPLNDRKHDKPGLYSFPPIACLITGAARLMLAMLEKMVTDAGGTWAFCDTDSMAIVADHKLGAVARYDIPVLSYAQTVAIADRFEALNPYDPAVATGMRLLKREYDSDPRTLYAYAIAAKRYALYRLAYRDGRITDVEILPGEGRKEHGIGTFMTPYDAESVIETDNLDEGTEDDAIEALASPYDTNTEPEKGKRLHVTQLWHYIISKDLGLNPAEPSFFSLPAMVKTTLTSWPGYQLFARYNEGKPWRDQIKPYNFVMSPLVTKLDQMLRSKDRRLRLVAPFTGSSEWLTSDYIDMNDPERHYSITTKRSEGLPDLSRSVEVQTWRDIASSFERHPEVKYCDQNGRTCEPDTRGILYRHDVKICHIDYIGKESNRLTASEKVLPDSNDAINNYGSGRDDVREDALPVLMACGYKSRKSAHDLSIDKVASRLDGHRDTWHDYFDLSDLTHVSRTLQISKRDPLIMLAVREAIKSFGDNIPDKSWLVGRVQRDNCWSILAEYKERMRVELVRAQ